MGGEGGGVLSDWLVDLAEHNGYLAQATSVPGVAQRTGATIYYVEMFPRAAAEQAGADPVLALMPTPGEVDLVVASELMEAGRALQRGLVTPDRTTLVASTHRVYAIAEKIAMADGRVDSERLLDGCRAAARQIVLADFAQVAERCGSVISAALFGAVAGSGRLPFSREQFEEAVRRGGIGVAASLRAFADGLTAAAASASGAVASQPGAVAEDGVAPGVPATATGTAAGAGGGTPQPSLPALGPRLESLARRIDAEFPAPVAPILRAGVARLADYQDVDYAAEYLDRLRPIRDAETRHGGGGSAVLAETARHLALWMSYEDTIRVADLKTRASRFDRVRREVRLRDAQLLQISEYLHPRLDEIADTLPASLGRWLLASGWPRRLVERVAARGRTVRTSSLSGFALLYFVASLRRMRRATLRFQVEQQRIDEWLAKIAATAARDPALATEIASCQRLVKGYSDTHARGWRNFERLMAALETLDGDPQAAQQLRALREAALADETGAQLEQALAAMRAARAPAPATEPRMTEPTTP
ncbi:MAG TPA: indolepyruvate oxidoreductase subunit beta family protein [Burkholderiaceae bacterium]|nr:indolepyruvate oxidoreductase subunit beta family protein [Burkholderiaceae bacterium]